MSRESVRSATKKMRKALSMTHRLVRELLAMDDDEWRDAVREDDDVRAADEFVYRQVHACISSKGEQAELFAGGGALGVCQGDGNIGGGQGVLGQPRLRVDIAEWQQDGVQDAALDEGALHPA